MPQAIAAWAISAVGATGFAATAITVGVNLAVAFSLSYLSTALFGKDSKPSDQQQIIREAVSARKRGYGITHVGGVLSFYESRDGTLYMLITNSQGEIAEILEHRLNNKVVTVSGTGVVTDEQYKGAISIHSKLGTNDQTAHSQLMSVFDAYTADHRQRGCGNTLVICRSVKPKEFAGVYEGNKPPEYSQVRKVTKVYDPRKDSTQIIGYNEGIPVYGEGPQRKDNPLTFAWADNSALVTGDYLAHPDGYGLGWDAVNWTNIAQEADICDELVQTVEGDYIPRYRTWLTYSLMESERKAVLRQLQETADIFLWQDADMKVNIQVGRWQEPTIHIKDDHIISLSGSKGPKPTEIVNEAKIVYTDARFDYKEQESAPLIDLASQDLLGPVNQRFDRFGAPCHNQGVRLGKRIMRRYGNRWHLVIVGNLYLLNLIGERFCYLTVSTLGIYEKPFEVTKLKLYLINNTVSITVSEVDESDWEFDASIEEGDPPQPPGSTYQAPTIPEPTNLVLSTQSTGAGTYAELTILAQVDEPARAGLQTMMEYKRTSDEIWLPMVVNQDAFTGVSGVIEQDSEYEVRAKHYSISGRESDWTTPETLTSSSADITAPTQFQVTNNAGSVSIECRCPPQQGFDHLKFMRHTSNSLEDASQISTTKYAAPSQFLSINDTPGTGTFYYWAVAFNNDESQSAATASIAVTV